MKDILREIAQKATQQKLQELEGLLKVAGRKYEKEVSSYLEYLYEAPSIVVKVSVEDVIDLIHLALLRKKSQHKVSIDRITKDVIALRSTGDEFYKKEMIRVYKGMVDVLGEDDNDNDSDTDDGNSEEGFDDETEDEEATPPQNIKQIIQQKIQNHQKQIELKKQENKDMRLIFAQAQDIWNACGFQGKVPKDFVFALRPRLREFGYDAIMGCAELFLSRKTIGMGWKMFIAQIPSLVSIVKMRDNPAFMAKKELVEKLYSSVTARNDKVTEEFYNQLYYAPYLLIRAKIDEVRRLEDARLLPKLTTIIVRALKEFKSMDNQTKKKISDQSKQVFHEDLKKFKINIAHKSPQTNAPKPQPSQQPTHPQSSQEDGGSNTAPSLPHDFFKNQNKGGRIMSKHKIEHDYKRRFAKQELKAQELKAQEPKAQEPVVQEPAVKQEQPVAKQEPPATQQQQPTIVTEMQDKMVSRVNGIDVNDKLEGTPSRAMKWAKNAVDRLLKDFVTVKNEKIDREAVYRGLRELAIMMALGPEKESRTRRALLSLLKLLSTENTVEWWEEVKDRVIFRMLTAQDYDELANSIFGSIDILKMESDKKLKEDKHFAQVVFAIILNSLSRYLFFKMIPPLKPQQQQQQKQTETWEERKKRLDEYKKILHSLKTPEEKWEFVMKVLQGGNIKSADEVLKGGNNA
jgi:hypothetical protein